MHSQYPLTAIGILKQAATAPAVLNPPLERATERFLINAQSTAFPAQLQNDFGKLSYDLGAASLGF